MKITIDSNIFISAAISGGKPEQILSLARRKKMEIFVSYAIIMEVVKTLKNKFYWTNQQIELVLEDIQKNTTTVFPNNKIDIIKIKPSDNRILECALEAKVDFIVSGDKKHILPLKKFRGIKIVNANDFLETYKK